MLRNVRLRRGPVEELHREFEAEKARSVGWKRSQHNRCAPPVQCQRAFLFHQNSEHIADAVRISALGCCLQPTLEYISRHSDQPVEDARRSASLQNSPSQSDLRPVSSFGRQQSLDEFVGGEVHSARRDISEKGGTRSFIDTLQSSLFEQLFGAVNGAGVLWRASRRLLNLQQTLYSFARCHDSGGENTR